MSSLFISTLLTSKYLGGMVWSFDVESLEIKGRADMRGKTGETWGIGLGAMEVEAARRREVLLSDAGWADEDQRRTATDDRSSLGRLVSAIAGRRAVRAEHRRGARPVGGRMTEV